MRAIPAALLSLALLSMGGLPALAQPPYPPVPPPRYEPVPRPPPGAYVWQPGHWRWNGVQYVWAPGRYVARRPHYGVWVSGRWVFVHGGWVWRPGHWR